MKDGMPSTIVVTRDGASRAGSGVGLGGSRDVVLFNAFYVIGEQLWSYKVICCAKVINSQNI